MSYNIHSKFILTPILDILDNGVTACKAIGDGIDTYPLCDYIVQSVFLKMTGAQEQKLKCICWEMASNDYTYRYLYLSNQGKYGEFSRYEQKNKVYTDLISEIKKLKSSFNIEQILWIKDVRDETKTELFEKAISKKVEQIIEKQSTKHKLTDEAKEKIKSEIREEANKDVTNFLVNPIKEYMAKEIKNKIKNIVRNSILFFGDTRNYHFWSKCEIFQTNNFGIKNNLLADSLKNYYEEIVIKQRHKCAHNLTSYQQNLPTFDSLSDKDYVYHNYFFYFSLLVLIDEIFMRLYTEYLEVLETKSYFM